MHTLSVLVASLMTVSFNNAPDDVWQSYGYYPANQESRVMLAAADETIPPQELDTPYAVDEPYAPLRGESYYMPEYNSCQCRYPGFHAGVELTCLRPYVGSTCIDPPCFPQNALVAVRELAPEFDFYAAPRLWLGYTCCSGLGLRVRWWQFDQNASSDVNFVDMSQNSFVGTTSGSFDVEAIDFEVTDALIVGNKWDLTFSGGVRYAKFGWTQSSEGTLSLLTGQEGDVFYADTDKFEGVGGTAAMELHRNVLGRLGVFANVRGSLLYGDATLVTVTEGDFLPPGASDIIVGVVRSVWEAQLGADWTHELWNGLYFTGRVAGEVQYWDSMVANTDAGFAGMTFAVGLIR